MKRRAEASTPGRSNRSDRDAEDTSLTLNEIRAQARSRKKNLWMQSDIWEESVERYQHAKLGKTVDRPLKTEVHDSKKRSSTKNHGKNGNRWSAEEDRTLHQMVNKHGTNSWQTVAHTLPNRSALQCRIRWIYSLNPAINKEAWSLQEELKLISAHQVYGDKWAQMVKHFPGRTNHGLREYWRRHLKGKLDSYLASGLLEQVPDLHNNQPSVPWSTQSDIPKDTEVSPDRNRLSSVFKSTSKSKPDIIELGGNGDTTEENNSNLIHPKTLHARMVKFSEIIVSKSQQRARARRKLGFLSTPACSAAQTPPICQMPTSRREEMSPSVCSVSSPNVVSLDCVDTILSTAPSDHSSDAHSSGTLDLFVSLEQREECLSDLLDMSYCDSLMIEPPSLPHENSFL